MEGGVVGVLAGVKLLMGRACCRMEYRVVGILPGMKRVVRGIGRGMERVMLRRLISVQGIMGDMEGCVSDVLSRVERRMAGWLSAMEAGVVVICCRKEGGTAGILRSVQRIMRRVKVVVHEGLIQMKRIVSSVQPGTDHVLTGVEGGMIRRLIHVKTLIIRGERIMP